MMKETPNMPLLARRPVTSGPTLWLMVLMTLMIPITAVLSLGRMTAVINAVRGAVSMDWLHARIIRNVMAGPSVEGIGIKTSIRADGRCVKTIACDKYQ